MTRPGFEPGPRWEYASLSMRSIPISKLRAIFLFRI
jgi:hypothetical protein